jgi:hypothetical protein
MRSITATALAAALATLLLQTAYAADPATPASRADVKAETRAANKAGELAPAGSLSPEKEPKQAKSTKTRAERKAETRAARKAGELKPAGTLSPEQEPKQSKSTQARAPIKAEAKAATKAGTIQRGEAPAGTK